MRPIRPANRRRLGAAAAAPLIACGLAALAPAGGGAAQDSHGTPQAASSSPAQTTLERRIVPRRTPGYRDLRTARGARTVVREGGFGLAKPGRAGRRRSLAYIGQLSDFQLADEESPGRVEALDPIGSPFEAAWRPWEALEPHIDDSMIRRMNRLVPHSPFRDRRGRRQAMDFAIVTGDSADSQQLNETRWVRTLLDGGRLDPNSGIGRPGYRHPLCPATGVPGRNEARGYTGVQDYRDYPAGLAPYFWSPDDPRGTFAHFPSYPGLMNRAQRPFQAAGLDVPSYVAFGNHDALVQGNQAASSEFEEIVTGCVKQFQTGATPRTWAAGLRTLTPRRLRAGLGERGVRAGSPQRVNASLLVPPDPARRFVSKPEFKRIIGAGPQRDGHGFGLIGRRLERASNGAAGYYTFRAPPRLRMIALDTVSEGGILASDGNVDDPQFRWLERNLQRAAERRERVILFSHHAIQSLTSTLADEAAPPCSQPDAHGHDRNPGCDLDPRTSTPIHLGDDLVDLLHRYPNVIAWVAGHSHVNDIQPYPDGAGSGFWMIRTAAEADWPQQARVLQLFKNRDGTLSLFGTVIDHASPARARPAGTSARRLGRVALASIGRTLAYNDNQTGARECDPGCGEGRRRDRNVELIIRDPLSRSGRAARTSDPPGGSAGP